MRAEAVTKLLEVETFPGFSYKSVIADYCRGSDLKSNTKAIAKAVLLAVDKGMVMVTI